MLTFEYEPTPRAFAVPLLICAIGLAAHRRYLAAGVAAAVALPLPSAHGAAVLGRIPRAGVWPAQRTARASAALLPLGRRRGASAGGGAHPVRVRRGAARLCAAGYRAGVTAAPARRVCLDLARGRLPPSCIICWCWPLSPRRSCASAATSACELRVLLLGLAALRLLTHAALLAAPGAVELGPGAAGAAHARAALPDARHAVPHRRRRSARVVARRPAEAFVWFAFAYLLPLQPLLTGPFVWSRVALAVALAAVTALAGIRRVAALVAGSGGLLRHSHARRRGELPQPPHSGTRAAIRSGRAPTPRATRSFSSPTPIAASPPASSAARPCAPSMSIGRAAGR